MRKSSNDRKGKKERVRQKNEKKVRDKDIHLNLLGVPQSKVNVNKTSPRQNDEDYHLYKISIDTTKIQKDQTTDTVQPPQIKKSNYNRSHEIDTPSSESDISERMLSSISKKGVKEKYEQPSTSRPKQKTDIDSDICFTIPGEKQREVRIIGNQTEPFSDMLPEHRSLLKSTKQQKQVGFSDLDAVYGTSPEQSSIETDYDFPYSKDIPQVYQVQDNKNQESYLKEPARINAAPHLSQIADENEKTEKNIPTKKMNLIPVNIEIGRRKPSKQNVTTKFSKLAGNTEQFESEPISDIKANTLKSMPPSPLMEGGLSSSYTKKPDINMMKSETPKHAKDLKRSTLNHSATNNTGAIPQLEVKVRSPVSLHKIVSSYEKHTPKLPIVQEESPIEQNTILQPRLKDHISTEKSVSSPHQVHEYHPSSRGNIAPETFVIEGRNSPYEQYTEPKASTIEQEHKPNENFVARSPYDNENVSVTGKYILPKSSTLPKIYEQQGSSIKTYKAQYPITKQLTESKPLTETEVYSSAHQYLVTKLPEAHEEHSLTDPHSKIETSSTMQETNNIAKQSYHSQILNPPNKLDFSLNSQKYEEWKEEYVKNNDKNIDTSDFSTFLKQSSSSQDSKKPVKQLPTPKSGLNNSFAHTTLQYDILKPLDYQTQQDTRKPESEEKPYRDKKPTTVDREIMTDKTIDRSKGAISKMASKPSRHLLSFMNKKLGKELSSKYKKADQLNAVSSNRLQKAKIVSSIPKPTFQGNISQKSIRKHNIDTQTKITPTSSILQTKHSPQNIIKQTEDNMNVLHDNKTSNKSEIFFPGDLKDYQMLQKEKELNESIGTENRLLHTSDLRSGKGQSVDLNHVSDDKSNLYPLTYSPQLSMNASIPHGKQYLPIGASNDPSVEISCKFYGESPPQERSKEKSEIIHPKAALNSDLHKSDVPVDEEINAVAMVGNYQEIYPSYYVKLGNESPPKTQIKKKSDILHTTASLNSAPHKSYAPVDEEINAAAMDGNYQEISPSYYDKLGNFLDGLGSKNKIESTHKLDENYNMYPHDTSNRYSNSETLSTSDSTKSKVKKEPRNGVPMAIESIQGKDIVHETKVMPSDTPNNFQRNIPDSSQEHQRFVGRNKPIAAKDVIAYHSYVKDQTPFEYDNSKEDPSQENLALRKMNYVFPEQKSLKNYDYQPEIFGKDELVNSSGIDDREQFPFNGKKSIKHLPETEYYITLDESKVLPISYPVKEIDYTPSTEKIINNHHNVLSPRENVYKPQEKAKIKSLKRKNKQKPSNQQEQTTNRGLSQHSTKETNKLKYSDGEESLFCQTPLEQMLYIGRIPNTTYNVFFTPETTIAKSSDLMAHQTLEGDKGINFNNEKSQKHISKLPKGIIIFVNKKSRINENPFTKNIGSVDRVDRDDTLSNKKNQHRNEPSNEHFRESGSLNRKLKDSQKHSMGNSRHVSGDAEFRGPTNIKEISIERSPSGRRLIEHYPCGCLRVITSDSNDELTSEEIISASCKDGSKCEVNHPTFRKRSTLVSSDSILKRKSTSESAELMKSKCTGDHPFPDIEVIADGIITRKRIRPKPPAPTMRGANFSGSLFIKSNKLNGVCNFYLDPRLKIYLRDNLNKFEALLTDKNEH